MARIPRDTSLDSTAALFLNPYGFIAERCARLRSDVFETRLLLQPTICMSGPEAAELFYDPRRFVREGAMPRRIKKTLIGEGAVQGLDGQEHRHRKGMFLLMMVPERLKDLLVRAEEQWRASARDWRSMSRVVLYDELPELLTRAVCAWAGVPLPEAEVAGRARDLTSLFDDAGSLGPRHWRARRARIRGELWMRQIVEEVRAGRQVPHEGQALSVIAKHRNLDGTLLDSRVAAVELLNVLRPTVAVSVYIVSVAHALHLHPEPRAWLGEGDERHQDAFVQEVRRFYPFFPAAAARVSEDFEWNGYPFPSGRRVMLDLYGTNHDPRSWEAPNEFRPERFLERAPTPFNFVPQGGGDHLVNHRCAGEWITIGLMKLALTQLSERMTYNVPPQDLRITRARLPALPRSRFVIQKVRVPE